MGLMLVKKDAGKSKAVISQLLGVNLRKKKDLKFNLLIKTNPFK